MTEELTGQIGGPSRSVSPWWVMGVLVLQMQELKLQRRELELQREQLRRSTEELARQSDVLEMQYSSDQDRGMKEARPFLRDEGGSEGSRPHTYKLCNEGEPVTLCQFDVINGRGSFLTGESSSFSKGERKVFSIEWSEDAATDEILVARFSFTNRLGQTDFLFYRFSRHGSPRFAPLSDGEQGSFGRSGDSVQQAPVAFVCGLVDLKRPVLRPESDSEMFHWLAQGNVPDLARWSSSSRSPTPTPSRPQRFVALYARMSTSAPPSACAPVLAALQLVPELRWPFGLLDLGASSG